MVSKKGPRMKGGSRDPFRDILDVARLPSPGPVGEKVIEIVVAHFCGRLETRSRRASLEGDDLRLRFYASEHTCPVSGHASTP
jgi:hypothetical protein